MQGDNSPVNYLKRLKTTLRNKCKTQKWKENWFKASANIDLTNDRITTECIKFLKLLIASIAQTSKLNCCSVQE